MYNNESVQFIVQHLADTLYCTTPCRYVVLYNKQPVHCTVHRVGAMYCIAKCRYNLLYNNVAVHCIVQHHADTLHCTKQCR
jgi:uncharacterized protein YlbG (UPF0298 family)